MPWTKENYPIAFDGLPGAVRERAIQQAEQIRRGGVARGEDEKSSARVAIATALKAVKRQTSEVNDALLAKPTNIRAIKANFDNRVRGVDIAIDKNHDHTQGAIGWIKELLVQESDIPGKLSLFADVEWTEFGKQEVPKYRYVSAEFGDHIDEETGKVTPNVLKAATLTLRPFIKNMQPVSLQDTRIELLREGQYLHPLLGEFSIKASELPRRYIDTHIMTKAIKGTGEDMKDEIAAILEKNGVKLAEDSGLLDALLAVKGGKDEEALRGKVTSLEEQLEAAVEQAKALEEKREAAAKAQQEGKKSDVVALEEVQGKVTALTEKLSAVEESNTLLTQKLFESERDVFLDKMLAEGKYFPKQREKYEKLYAMDVETTVALLTESEAVIDLKSRGADGGNKITATEKLDAAALQLMEKDSKLSYREAIVRVGSGEPDWMEAK